jgi:hypothetical protein
VLWVLHFATVLETGQIEMYEIIYIELRLDEMNCFSRASALQCGYNAPVLDVLGINCQLDELCLGRRDCP